MPTPGIRSLARALSYWQRAQSTTSNNLANVNTDGFKATHLTALLGADGFMPLAQEQMDLSQGSLTHTGGALDIALEGEGFLVIGTEQGEQLSRGGTMRVSATGVLVDVHGNPVLGTEGPIPVGGGEVQIMDNGVVVVDGKPVDTLRLVTADPATLQRVGESRFVSNAPLAQATNAQVLQGTLEGANIDAVGSMVDMIRVQRAFESSMTAMRAIDETMGSATRLGSIR